jgi:hypothetical protein
MTANTKLTGALTRRPPRPPLPLLSCSAACWCCAVVSAPRQSQCCSSVWLGIAGICRSAIGNCMGDNLACCWCVLCPNTSMIRSATPLFRCVFSNCRPAGAITTSAISGCEQPRCHPVRVLLVLPASAGGPQLAGSAALHTPARWVGGTPTHVFICWVPNPEYHCKK